MPKDYPTEKIRLHTDPFYAECRAYGRIKEAEQNMPDSELICVPCYGYIMLSEADREILEERFRLQFNDQRHPHGFPLRAIVKQYLDSDFGITAETLERTRHLIRRMNQLQIYNRDIQLGSFRNGLLNSFDCAWTEPHCFIQDVQRPGYIAENKDYDKKHFDIMLEDLKFDRRHAFYPDSQPSLRLRDQTPY